MNEIMGKGDTEQVMTTYPFLVPLIDEACTEIKRYFPQADIRLDIVTDPECGEREAVLSILTTMDAEEAVNTLSRFDEEWWLERLPQAQGRLCITLEFV